MNSMPRPPFEVPSDCTPEAIEFIAERTSALEEIGAGIGWWAARLRDAGIAVRALDPQPRGPGVEQGSHMSATPGADVLIVWPPDRLDVYEWVRATRPSLVFTVGQRGRFDVRALAAHYAEEASILVHGGRKEIATLAAWRLR